MNRVQLLERQQAPTTSVEHIEDPELVNIVEYDGEEPTEADIEAMERRTAQDAMSGIALADTVEGGRAEDTSHNEFSVSATETEEVYSQYPTVEGESLLEKEVQMTIDALVKQYEQYGVKAEDFGLVGDTVMYTAIKGIDLGDPKKDLDPARSWDVIMKDPTDERFVIEIDGRTVDTRIGMTKKLYRAFVQAKKDADEELPDSRVNKLDDKWRTSTLLTGEAVYSYRYALNACVSFFDLVWVDWAYRVYGCRNVLFRPTVELTTPDLR